MWFEMHRVEQMLSDPVRVVVSVVLPPKVSVSKTRLCANPHLVCRWNH